MMKRKTPLSIMLLLFFLFFVGLALNILIILDVTWFQIYLVPRSESSRGETVSSIDDSKVEEVSESVVLVLVPSCDSQRLGSGTGFVVKPGFVATAAHVIGDHYACGSEIRLVDSYGVEHRATGAGFSEEKDLALLRISDTSIPRLRLADSRGFQEISGSIEIVAIGYPLLGATSVYDSVAISSEGRVSGFDPDKNLFVSSGISTNTGSSGGPIFLKGAWSVIGVASAKRERDATIVGDMGYFVPIDVFKQFFFDTTGETLD